MRTGNRDGGSELGCNGVGTSGISMPRDFGGSRLDGDKSRNKGGGGSGMSKLDSGSSGVAMGAGGGEYSSELGVGNNEGRCNSAMMGAGDSGGRNCVTRLGACLNSGLCSLLAKSGRRVGTLCICNGKVPTVGRSVDWLPCT
jgi:hypothetical protein